MKKVISSEQNSFFSSTSLQIETINLKYQKRVMEAILVQRGKPF